MEGKTFKVILAVCMMFGALFVVITCVWKLVKLVAKFKIEGRMEELEQLSKRRSEAEGGDANGVVVSPEEARKLRRLSILAGFDRKISKSARSSFSEAVAGLRRPLKLFTHENRNGKTDHDAEGHEHVAHHESGVEHGPAPNGRIYSNFLSPGSGETYQPPATTPQLPSQPAEILESNETSPTASRRPAKLCAVHGSKLRSGSGSYSANKSPSPPPPPPPPPFATMPDCSDPSPGIRSKSHRGSATMLIPVHCVNPNHYHHFHHHHDALSVTVNPAAYAATAAASSCVICHLSSSLFHLHPSSVVSPCSPMKVEDNSPDDNSCSEDDEESEEEQDDHDDHDEQDEPEEGQAEAVKVKHRQMVAGTPPPPANRCSFRDISGLREPIYSDGIGTRSDVTVHWNGGSGGGRCSTPTNDLDQ